MPEHFIIEVNLKFKSPLCVCAPEPVPSLDEGGG